MWHACGYAELPRAITISRSSPANHHHLAAPSRVRRVLSFGREALTSDTSVPTPRNRVVTGAVCLWRKGGLWTTTPPSKALPRMDRGQFHSSSGGLAGKCPASPDSRYGSDKNWICQIQRAVALCPFYLTGNHTDCINRSAQDRQFTARIFELGAVSLET